MGLSGAGGLGGTASAALPSCARRWSQDGLARTGRDAAAETVSGRRDPRHDRVGDSAQLPATRSSIHAPRVRGFAGSRVRARVARCSPPTRTKVSGGDNLARKISVAATRTRGHHTVSAAAVILSPLIAKPSSHPRQKSRSTCPRRHGATSASTQSVARRASHFLHALARSVKHLAFAAHYVAAQETTASRSGTHGPRA